MSDEGVHEIQLNGKQLVFMFMAVTVVAVVIFLCGVMVGRGVRAPRATEQANVAVETPIDPTAPIQSPAPTVSNAPATGSPVSSTEKLTYADRLITTTPPPETLKEPVSRDVKSAVAVKPPAKETAAPAARAASKAAATEAASGYVVQVTAVKERSEADTIAKRLASKGFPSFVTTPSAGAAPVYRVRVGKYKDRREAETVALRLQREEQFKPWITR